MPLQRVQMALNVVQRNKKELILGVELFFVKYSIRETDFSIYKRFMKILIIPYKVLFK